VILVLDASVVLKWFFREAADEEDTSAALDLLSDIGQDRIQLIQPPHFLAEVAAVLARKVPAGALDDLRDLQLLQFRTAADADLHQTAVELALRLDAHVFDTLYHATALHHPDAGFITADRRYYRKAKYFGGVQLLGQA